MTYRQRPVAVREDLEAADAEFRAAGAQFTSVFLINCGGTLPLAHVLPSAPASAVLYVIDSHRPYHPANVADTEKVVLLGGEHDTAPDAAAAVEPAEPASKRPRSSSSSSDDTGDNNNGEENEEEEEEDTGSYYGASAAEVAFWLAESEGRDGDVDVQWWAIVGATDQLVHRRASRAAYDAFARAMRRRLGADSAPGNSTSAADAADTTVAATAEIAAVRELRLVLLRHWSLYESVLHSPAFAARLGLWRQNGRDKLALLLARAGVPLAQSRAPYAALPAAVRARAAARLPACIAPAALPDRAALALDTFVRDLRGPRRLRVAAADAVYAADAVLAARAPDAFWRAHAALAAGAAHTPALAAALAAAVEQQRAVVAQAAAMLAARTVVMAGPFRYALLHESALLRRFVHPLALARLAHFLMDALNVCRASPFPLPFPLFVCASRHPPAHPNRKSDPTTSPCYSRHSTRTHTASSLSRRHRALSLPQTKSLFFPIPPRCSTNFVTTIAQRSQFGLLFQEIAERTQTKITHHGFDSAVVQIHQDDMTKFMDELTTALLDDPSAATA